MNWMSALGLESLLLRCRATLNEGAIAAEDRVALARLEWQEQKNRMVSILVLGIILGGLTIVSMTLLSFAVLINFWDSPDRALVAWVIAGIWLVLWVVVLLLVIGKLRKSSNPFALTRAELVRDWTAIKERL